MISNPVSTAGGLELDDLQGSFRRKPFSDSMELRTAHSIQV